MRTGAPFTNPDATPTHVVTAGGSVIDTQRVAVTRSVGGAGLPSELGGGGDPVPAQADVEVVPDHDRGNIVYQGSPWRRQGGRPLPLGTALTIDTGEDGTTYRQFTGAVTADDGDHTAAMNLHAEDDLSWLSRIVSWESLFEVMPPAQSAPATYRSQYRRIGLSHWYALDRALRSVRRGTHPVWGGGVGVSMPLVDSSWPEFGTLLSSYSHVNGSAFLPAFARSIGLRTRCVTDLWAVVQPSAALNLSTTGRVSVGLRVAPEHNGDTVVSMRWPTGGGAALVVNVTAGRTVRVYSSANTAAVTSLALGAESIVRVQVTSAGAVTITTPSTSAAGTVVVPAEWTGSNMDRVEVQVGSGSLLGGLQVTSANLNTYLTWTQPTLFYPSPDIPAGLEWLPRSHQQDVSAIVSEGCRAACLSWGVNADGLLQIKAPDQARISQGTTTTLTADLIGALAWSRDVDTVRHQVVIRHESGEIDQNLQPTAVLWQAGGKTLAAGESSVDIANVPADEEWLPCTELHYIGDAIVSTEWGNPDKGRGTVVGGWPTADGQTRSGTRWADDDVTVTLDTAPTAGLYVFKTTTIPANMVSGEEIVLGTAPMEDTNTTLPSRYRDQPLPVLRGWVRMTKTEVETRSVQTGPDTAPDLVHDAGWWVQKGAAALAEWLAAKACPQEGEVGIVTLDQIPIRTDHRLEAGDVVTIHDQDVTYLQLTVLLRSVSVVSGPGESSMSLDVEVIDGHSTLLTVGEVDAEFAGSNVGDVDTAKAGTNLALDTLNPTLQDR